MFHTSTTTSGTRESPLVMCTVPQKKQEESALSAPGSHIPGSLSSPALPQHRHCISTIPSGPCGVAATWLRCPPWELLHSFLSELPPPPYTHTLNHPSNCWRRQGGRRHLYFKGKQSAFGGEVAFFRTHRTQQGWMRLGAPGGASGWMLCCAHLQPSQQKLWALAGML